MWSRAAWQYRVSLLLTGTAQTLSTCLDLAALLVIYSQVKTLGGFTLPQTLYLYGTTRLAFALSDVLASGIETLSDSIRLGTFDIMLIRPVSTLAQVLADQFTPKRFGKLIPATATLVWSIESLPIIWTPLKAAVCVGTILCGTVIYCALWVLTGSISFVATDARETANIITYGGELVTEYPFGIYRRPMALMMTFATRSAFPRSCTSPRPSSPCCSAPSPASSGAPPCAATAPQEADSRGCCRQPVAARGRGVDRRGATSAITDAYAFAV
jgi:ABC-2 type transport system permease protein